ncbi:MAG: toxin-antitoxin system HicB family antitoxin [Kineosporiaceae bacterium]
MQLDRYVDDLRRHLADVVVVEDEASQALLRRVSAGMGAAARLVLLEALAAAADEIAAELVPGSVEVRLDGRDPRFVVVPPVDEGHDGWHDHTRPPDALPPPDTTGVDGGTTRINLRLPESLKARVDEAARRERLSVNAWLVRAVAAAVDPAPPSRTGRRDSQHYTGWVR